MLPAAIICSLITACGGLRPKIWHLTASKQDNTVQLCLSEGKECPQPGGIRVSGISVYRYDSMYDNILVWEAEPNNPESGDTIDGLITYGIAPKGWQNKGTPPALVCGKAYLFNPAALYFALNCDGTVVVFDSPHLEYFFRHIPHPAPQ